LEIFGKKIFSKIFRNFEKKTQNFVKKFFFRKYFRDSPIPSVGLKPTGRQCENAECNGDLHDFTLDWEDKLPEPDYQIAQEFVR